MDLYSDLNKNLYRESATEDGSDSSFTDPTLLSSDNVIEFGQFRKLSVNGVILTVPKGEEIQKALNKVSELGGGEVRLAQGTHFPTNNIVIPSNVTLSGTGSATTIDFGGGALQVQGVGEFVYSTGTVAINNESTTVTGTGTTWTAAMEGNSILIGEFWYPVETVNSTTSITISIGYQGVSISGVTYIIASTVSSVNIKDLIIQNSSVALVKLQYVNGGFFKNLICAAGDVGIDGDDSSFFSFDTCTADSCSTGMTFNNFRYGTFFNGSVANSTNNGVEMTSCSNWGIEITSFYNNGGEAITFTSCSNIGFEDFTIDVNDSHGIEFVSGNSDITLSDGTVKNSGGDGIKLTATSDRIDMVSMHLLNNGGYGVNIAASSCDNNTLTVPTFSGNSSGDYQDLGTGTNIVATQKRADVLIPHPPYEFNQNNTTSNYAVNTVLHVSQIVIPVNINANKLTISVTAVNTAGTLDIALFQINGQSKVFDITTASISATGKHTHTFSSPVVISAGTYYIAVNTNGTCDLNIDTYVGASSNSQFFSVTGKPVLVGTITISAGAMPSTIDPNSITEANTHCLAFRLDN